MHTSAASDHSSQSGMAGLQGGYPSESRSRRKVVALEEKPLLSCGRRKVRRSGFQAYGVIVSLARMCAYGLIIGGLGEWAEIQAAVALGVSIAYFGYLRFAVPYSRRDEMALEYWVAFIDVIFFTLVMVLTAAVDTKNFSTIDSLGLALIAMQCLGFASYLVNRGLIIVHAFMEVVCPACSCSPPSPKKRRSRSRSGSRSERSISMSMSDVGIRQESFSPDGKSYYAADSVMTDGKDSSGSEPQDGGDDQVYLAPPVDVRMYGNGAAAPAGLDPARSSSRAASRLGSNGLFPAIVEETDSQMGSPANSRLPAPVSKLKLQQLETESPMASARQIVPALPPLPPIPQDAELGVSQGPPADSNKGSSTVFDKFWKSL